ncbi:MAG: winged helix-turn-helix transcriptional regulator [Chitinivibrionales bacterium]|nr:winged helix-turn-helix transcriptional regulator [Chitinivibrionales bacterium]
MRIEQIRAFRKSIRIFERILDADLKNDDISGRMGLHKCHIIIEINELKETSLKNLESILGLDKSTLSKTVDALVKQGLVLRTESSQDRRFITCSLTELGKQIAETVNRYCDDRYLQVFKGIPETDHDTVLASLEKLAAAMKIVYSKQHDTSTDTKTIPLQQQAS